MDACLVDRAPQALWQPCLAGSNGPLRRSFKPGEGNQPAGDIGHVTARLLLVKLNLQSTALCQVSDAMDDCFAAA